MPEAADPVAAGLAAVAAVAGDAEIIEAVLRGNADRYGELVDRYQLAAWKLAYSFVGNFEDAKDLSQNSFVKAYRNLGKFRRQSGFSTWLYRIVVNECKDFFKQKSRQPAPVSLPENPEEDDPVLFEIADPSGDPRSAMEETELARELSRAIHHLPERQKAAFILCQIEGLSLQEASQVMECRLGTVKAHLFRATENVRALLEPYVTTEVNR